MGLIGAVMGLLPLGAVALEVLVNPPDTGRWLVTIPIAMSSSYVLAAWASVRTRDRERRMLLLRACAIGSLLTAVLGTLLFGSVLIMFVLAPATALLWIASGGLGGGRRD